MFRVSNRLTIGFRVSRRFDSRPSLAIPPSVVVPQKPPFVPRGPTVPHAAAYTASSQSAKKANVLSTTSEPALSLITSNASLPTSVSGLHPCDRQDDRDGARRGSSRPGPTKRPPRSRRLLGRHDTLRQLCGRPEHPVIRLRSVDQSCRSESSAGVARDTTYGPGDRLQFDGTN